MRNRTIFAAMEYQRTAAMIDRNPCLDCPDRRVGCHGGCRAYTEAAAQRRAIRQAERQGKEADDYHYGISRKMVRAKHNRRSKGT